MDAFRKELIEQRQKIARRSIKEEAIRERLKPWLKPFDKPRLYFPLSDKGEIDIIGLRKEFDKQFLFPVVIDKENSLMVFKEPKVLKKGSYGIVEPAKGEEIVPDLLIVPLLAFHQTNRLGYGKGFYDAYLKAHPEIISIGVAFDEQEKDFEINPWDVPLDVIITPTRVIEKSNLKESKLESKSRPQEQKAFDLAKEKR